MKYCSKCDDHYHDAEFNNHMCECDTPIESTIKVFTILGLFGIFVSIIWFALRALLGYA